SRPRLSAVWESSWHMKPVTMATFGLTACSIGSHSFLKGASYSSTQYLGSLRSMYAKVSAPLPSLTARPIVVRVEHATDSGGCGRCTGFGTMLRCGIEKYLPLKPG